MHDFTDDLSLPPREYAVVVSTDIKAGLITEDKILPLSERFFLSNEIKEDIVQLS